MPASFKSHYRNLMPMDQIAARILDALGLGAAGEFESCPDPSREWRRKNSWRHPCPKMTQPTRRRAKALTDSRVEKWRGGVGPA
jgi:hypothetical protein